jgi:hypothetical protein
MQRAPFPFDGEPVTEVGETGNSGALPKFAKSLPKLPKREGRYRRLAKGLYRDRSSGSLFRVVTTHGKTKWTKEVEPEEPLEPRIAPLDILVAPDATPDLFTQIDPRQLPQAPHEKITERLDEISRVMQALQPVKTLESPKSKHTLKEATDLWVRGRAVSDSTKSKDQNLISMLADAMPLTTLIGDIDEQAVRQLQADLRDSGYANSTNNDILRKVLLPVLDTAHRQDWIAVNPASEVKPLKKIEPDRRQPSWEMAIQSALSITHASAWASSAMKSGHCVAC